jgi:hypothetical protein
MQAETQLRECLRVMPDFLAQSAGLEADRTAPSYARDRESCNVNLAQTANRAAQAIEKLMGDGRGGQYEGEIARIRRSNPAKADELQALVNSWYALLPEAGQP